MPVVIITGASGGLGTALTVAFAAAGYGLILQCNNRDVPEAEIRELVKEPLDVVKGDLRELAVLDRIEALARNRRASLLINNAAEYLNKSFDEVVDDEIYRLVEVDLIAPIVLTRRVWPIFKDCGMVVNINSLAGKDGGKGESLYCAAKHGLAGFGKALQFDGTRDGVRVLNVYVGAMKTPMAAWRGDQDKLIDPIEVATVIEQLCVSFDSLRVSEVTLVRRNY